MDRIDYLDGWRGLAIAMVLCAHFVGISVVNVGRFGVDLFFVLSGLLMARILFEKRTPILEFYRRRISRIFPALFAFLAITLTVEALRGAQVTTTEVLSLVTFTRTYIGKFILNDPLPVGHLWSLNLEEHCYLILSLVAVAGALRRRASLVLLSLGLATFAALPIHRFLSPGPDVGYVVNTECAATCLMLSASYRLMPKLRVPGQLVPIALLLAFGCYIVNLHHLHLSFLVAPFLLAFAVNHLERAPAWFLALLRLSWLRWFGLVSYSVYLWQEPFCHGGLNAALGITGALVVGSASFYLLEQPLRDWLNAHWGQRRILSQPLLVRRQMEDLSIVHRHRQHSA